MPNPKIAVVFSETLEGNSALLFAADLAHLVGNDTLRVIVRHDNATSRLLANRDAQQWRSQQNDLVVAAVRAKLGQTCLSLELVEVDEPWHANLPADLLLVDAQISTRREDLDTVTPFEETALLGRKRGPIMVPFGHGDSPFEATRLAFEIALAAGLELLFYHTTWRDPKVSSEDPADHVCAEAKAVRQRLEQEATAQGIAFKTVIECADEVAEGFIRCAMREGVCLIAMARGAKTVIGHYGEQALIESPVPVLLAARKGDSNDD